MQHSAETRWFIPKKLQDNVSEWFKNNYHVEPTNVNKNDSLEFEEPRDDFYLLFAGSESVNVKLRGSNSGDGDKFEIKALVGQPKLFDSGNGITGQLNCWVKWSTENAGLLGLKVNSQNESGKWVRVSKTRLVRRFSFADESVVEVSSRNNTFSQFGCNVELTSIYVEADPDEWYSISFETFGSSVNTNRILEQTVSAFFDKVGTIPGEQLNTLNSFSYAGWFTTLNLDG